MRKLKKYLLDSLKFFVCALFWLDFEDVELTHKNLQPIYVQNELQRK